MLEEKAGIDDRDVIYAHGSAKSAYCSVCRVADSPDETIEALKNGTVRYCSECEADGIKSPVKPGVVFFGEAMPNEFLEASTETALPGRRPGYRFCIIVLHVDFQTRRDRRARPHVGPARDDNTSLGSHYS